MNLTEISRQFDSYAEDIESQLSGEALELLRRDGNSAGELLDLTLLDGSLSQGCLQDFLRHPEKFERLPPEQYFPPVLLSLQTRLIAASLRAAGSLSPLDDPEEVFQKFQKEFHGFYARLHGILE